MTRQLRVIRIAGPAGMAIALATAVPAHAASEPAGGAATADIVIATLGASLLTALLLALGMGHRSGRVKVLGSAAAWAEQKTGLPGWAALPSIISSIALLVALVGMYWDISLHIDQGRDAGPLANPAHYLILAGLFGCFIAGFFAMVLPMERPGRSAVRITRTWYAPVGGVLLFACAAFSLSGFPLDDFWHRLFGQDVTLWGPTHLMLIGGAAMTLVGRSVLLVEGARVARERRGTSATTSHETAPACCASSAAAAWWAHSSSACPPSRRSSTSGCRSSTWSSIRCWSCWRRRVRPTGGRRPAPRTPRASPASGWKTQVELRHAEVELGLEGGEADQEGAHERRRAGTAAGGARARARAPRVPRVSRATRAPSTSSTERPTRVIAAPPISIRCVGPQSVTSWPNSRCQKSSSGKPESENARTREQQHAADRRVPRAGDAHGAAAGALGGQDHRQEAGHEAPEQAGEDQVVGGVGERAGVTPLVDVQGDVPVHAEQRDEQRDRGDDARKRRPARQPGLALGPGGARGRAP